MAADMATLAMHASAWRLILCYGSFGFGYIIPATFLPAAARSMISDETVFGWVWPLFGIAAASSTVLASSILGNLQPRRAWAYGQFVMAFGVALPAVQTTLFSIIVSAMCVGGTFMVITMAGIQEARRIAAQSAPRLVAAMTAAFAAGQVSPTTRDCRIRRSIAKRGVLTLWGNVRREISIFRANLRAGTTPCTLSITSSLALYRLHDWGGRHGFE